MFAACAESVYVPFGRIITCCPQQLYVVMTAALNEFGSSDLMTTSITNCASLSYVSYQVNDVVFLFQTSEQRLNAWKHLCGCCPIIAPVYFRTCFEKIVKSVVNCANQNLCCVNLIFIFPKQSRMPLRCAPTASRSS